MSDGDLVRLYGPWAGHTPGDAAELLDGYPGLWWVAGGWAVQAFTGVVREHADCDVSILRDDLPLLRAHLAGVLDVWAAAGGALHPLDPATRPAAAADDVLPQGCSQVWTRRDGRSAWDYDVLLTPGSDSTWVYRRDTTLTLPMTDALWERDGVRYLQPEIQLLFKARGRRPKDDADLEATLPLLDEHRRSWLLDALRRTAPAHPWAQRLAAPA